MHLITKWRWLSLLGPLTLPGSPVAAQEPDSGATTRRDGEAALAALQPLAGACWRGQFGDGPAYDVMCAETMPGGFLRTRHVVRGITGSYSGETIYFVDPASGEARFTYYTSLGAIQQGRVERDGSKLHFRDIRHVARRGDVLHFVGTGGFGDDGSYRTTTRQWKDGAWQVPSELVLVKIGCADWEAVMAGCD